MELLLTMSIILYIIVIIIIINIPDEIQMGKTLGNPQYNELYLHVIKSNIVILMLYNYMHNYIHRRLLYLVDYDYAYMVNNYIAF